jgi:Holliday junction resolvase-like predicted endonuclease
LTLNRRTPLRAKPHSKGNRAERAIIDILKARGYVYARRNFQSGGQGGGDIIEGPPDVHIEVKHREQTDLQAWLRQAEGEARPTDIASVWFRCNRRPWYVCFPRVHYEDLFADKSGKIVVHKESQNFRIWALIDEALDEVGTTELMPVVIFNKPGTNGYVIVTIDDFLDALKRREERNAI